MALKQKYKKFALHNEGYEIAENRREPGDPIIEIGYVDIDRSVFKKSDHEKAILKLAKLKAKQEDMKK